MRVLAVESSSDASVYLELAEASLNEISLFIEFFVVGYRFVSAGFGGDDRQHRPACDEGMYVVGIVAFVCENGLGGLAFKQVPGALTIRALASGEDETKRSA